MWPDLETRVDLFNYRGLASTIAGLIREPHLTPLTIGIHGEWGSGKSSIMEMVSDELKETEFLKVRFNGWAFEGFEDAKLALMETLVDELARNKTVVANVKDRVVDLAKRLNYLKLIKKAASLALTMHGLPIDIDGLLKSFREGSKPGAKDANDNKLTVAIESDDPWLSAAATDVPSHIHGFRTQLASLIANAKAGRLVVFIDDLDRCLPDTAIETLEAIKLFLAVEGAIFVIAADDAFIEYAVSKHFPGIAASSGPGTMQSNYLEKVIQVPFKLPRLNRTESRRYISLLLMQNVLRANEKVFEALLDAVAQTAVLPWEPLDLSAVIAAEQFAPYVDRLTEQLRLASQISAPLDDIANGNPRQIKRFLNTLTLRRRIAQAFGLADKIDDRVLAKLMLLERFAPSAYESIVAIAVTRVDGTVPFIELLEARDLEADGPAALRDESVPNSFSSSERELWLISWLRSSTKLGGIDLRPYIFISRENPTEFAIGATIDAALGALARQLMDAEPFAAASLQPQIAALTSAQRATIADLIWHAVSAGGDLDHRPPQLANIHLLTTDTAEAQELILNSMERLALSSIRPWMPSFLSRIARLGEAPQRLDAILTRWEASSNAEVVAAVRFVKSA